MSRSLIPGALFCNMRTVAAAVPQGAAEWVTRSRQGENASGAHPERGIFVSLWRPENGAGAVQRAGGPGEGPSILGWARGALWPLGDMVFDWVLEMGPFSGWELRAGAFLEVEARGRRSPSGGCRLAWGSGGGC